MRDQAIAEIMSQVQVYASAWSLVGGRFDTGGCMADAKEAKDELKTMLQSAVAAQPDCRTCRHSVNTGYEPLHCVSTDDCTNGDKYQEAPAVVLWGTK